MRVLVSGDLQVFCADSGSPRSEQTRNTLSWILGELDRQKPDLFVHLGDYGEDNRGTDHYSLTLMTWFASQVFQRVPESYWLVGNHDYFTEDGSVNLMTALGSLFPANHHVTWPWMGGPEGTMFVSYLNPGMRERWRAEAGLVFSSRDSHVLFSHLPVTGAMWGPGQYEQDGLDPNAFPRHTIVGHYHKPNPPDLLQVGTGHCIWYCGSPMAHDFRDNAYGLSESQQLRGIWLFDIQGGLVSQPPMFIENPHCTYYLSLSANVEHDPNINSGKVHDDWFNERCCLPLDRTVVRVVVPPDCEEQAQAVFGAISKGVTVLREDRHSAQGVSQAVVINPDAAPEQAVPEYVDGLPPDKLQGLESETLKQVGVQLIQGQYQLPEGETDAGQAHSV